MFSPLKLNVGLTDLANSNLNSNAHTTKVCHLERFVTEPSRSFVDAKPNVCQ